MKENLILKAYRGESKEQDIINIDISSHTYGYEMYRISLMLLDKIIQMDESVDNTHEGIKQFFDKLGDDYIKFYQK